MRIHPLIASLRRHKATGLLVVVQVAVTLAVTMNALYIINSHIAHAARPTGLDERDLFVISQSWVDPPDVSTTPGALRLAALQEADLNTLKTVSNVRVASAISSVPLLNEMRVGSVATKPDARSKTLSALYYGDADSLAALGISLADGRNFTKSDVHDLTPASPAPSIALISKATAMALFDQPSALGRLIYINGSRSPTRIIGTIKLLETPNTSSWGDTFAYQSILLPGRLNFASSRYVVRVEPGHLTETMKAVYDALYSENPMRTIGPAGISSFKKIRARAYESDKATAEVLVALCAVLLFATGGGIAGLSTFWVGQRLRQIGLRRALGATRRAILIHYLLENALLSIGGIVLGVLLSAWLQSWLLLRLEMKPMPAAYGVYGGIMIFALSQLAALSPALRAASVEPMEAARAR